MWSGSATYAVKNVLTNGKWVNIQNINLFLLLKLIKAK